MSSPATMLRLLGSIREHLTTHRLTMPLAAVTVGCDPFHGEHVKVQLAPMLLPELAAVLLDWADTLAQISVTVWRPPHGQTVHLTLAGVRHDGARVVVFSGVPFSEELFGDLQPEGQHGVALPVLRSWAAEVAA